MKYLIVIVFIYGSSCFSQRITFNSQSLDMLELIDNSLNIKKKENIEKITIKKEHHNYDNHQYSFTYNEVNNEQRIDQFYKGFILSREYKKYNKEDDLEYDSLVDLEYGKAYSSLVKKYTKGKMTYLARYSNRSYSNNHDVSYSDSLSLIYLSVYKYDSLGRKKLTKDSVVSEYSRESIDVVERKYSYNSYGDLIQIYSKTKSSYQDTVYMDVDVINYKYTFDINNNWIKAWRVMEDRNVLLISRELYYR
jgi:hypothetical protein